MLKTKILDCLKKIIEESIPIEISVPENEKFGHYSTNAALRLAKIRGEKPMEIANKINSELRIKNSELFGKIEVAPPGFVNFWLSEKVLQNELKDLLKKKEKYGSLKASGNRKINIEFISANPTGELTIGNGRGGFLGDVLARILEFAGCRISREYYVNDAKVSTQIKELGKTALGEGISYKTKNLELKIEKLGPKLKKLTDYGEAGYLLAKEIQKENKKFIEKDLKIKFDSWFSEENLYQGRTIEKLLQDLEEKKLVYKKDGALWFTTKDFGDSEDRVLIRTTEEPTYFLSDLAYHLNKFQIRKFDKAIDIWGADHHGYLPRLKAGLRALGIPEDKLMAIITQLVRLRKGNEEVKMSKRSGEFITLKDLIGEVGLDAARFFFLMSSPDTHMDFDLDLAKEKSLKNPVYYVQYAGVRIQSILAKIKIINKKSEIDYKLLDTPEDINLMRMLARFPESVEAAAGNYNPQALVRYALDLSREFHNFYEKEKILGEKQDLMVARLELIKATQIVFKNLFNLLGINLPEKM
ncbi:MAG: arginine--tRNA ligase [Candidatus Paceibacterota bacterium]